MSSTTIHKKILLNAVKSGYNRNLRNKLQASLQWNIGYFISDTHRIKGLYAIRLKNIESKGKKSPQMRNLVKTLTSYREGKIIISTIDFEDGSTFGLFCEYKSKKVIGVIELGKY